MRQPGTSYASFCVCQVPSNALQSLGPDAGQCLTMCRVLNMRCCQVLKLSPGLEARLLTLLRGRILPVAQRSLRLWKKGDALPHPLHGTAFCLHLSTRAPKFVVSSWCGSGHGVWQSFPSPGIASLTRCIACCFGSC